MHASWKIASSALLVLVLSGTGGCAVTDDAEDATSAPGDGATSSAQEADHASCGARLHSPPPGVVVLVTINENGQNDTGIAIGGQGHHHGHGYHGGSCHGFHKGHHGDRGGPQPSAQENEAPATPPPPPPPAEGPAELGQGPS